MGRIRRAIGMMSGTSMDGVDVALVETDGDRIHRLGPVFCRPYAEGERAVIRAALEAAPGLARRDGRPPALAAAERVVTDAHVAALRRFMDDNGLTAQDVDVIGFHGQTALHRPQAGLTVQLGDGQALADAAGVAVVYDMRAADVAAGGQGAPLVPVFHAALARMVGLAPPLAFLNIGGVANVTFVRADGGLVAFDTGPGNALVDDWMRLRAGRPMDAGGAAAAAGKPDEALLNWLTAHPWFSAPPPKSLDRNWFSPGVAAHLALEDGAATLTRFTVRAVTRALAFAGDPPPRRWIVCGGGAHNREMMRLLREALPQATVITAAQAGLDADFIEAQAFAYLAVRSLEGLPLTFPATTGAPRPLTGGVTARPRR
ncbi:anhydro-N-acetylmuramic acid kinase [Camelimonas abortus]|uniref:Anhydro-N-acetylmuramic acid kinase n=1 Tax=Camelimonas abortus TaxID=1017184 RepID=A0ABV7LHA0_9HYPH